nr:tetratricopeptide repeat protein [uncultured Anaeromusa sp.]
MMKKEQLAEAEYAFRLAIKENENFPEACNNLAVVLRKNEKWQEAEAFIKKAVGLRPQYPEAYYNWGLTLAALGNIEDAIEAYCKAIELRPDYPEAYNNLGIILLKQGKVGDAEKFFHHVIELNPDFSEAYSNLSAVLKDGPRIEEAEGYAKRAIKLSPMDAEAHNNLGAILRNQNRLVEAERCFLKAVELRANFPEAFHNLAMTLMETGTRLNEAESLLKQSLELRPDFAEAEYTLAALYFLQGNYKQGWEKYEARFAVFNNYQPPVRRWQGEFLEGKHILLSCEQGFGDTLQFIRYAAVVAKQARHTTVLVQKSLVGLFANSEKITFVSSVSECSWDEYDFACPLLSLPMLFGTDEDSIPAEIPYIFAAETLINKWKDILAKQSSGDELKVGIVWAGNPGHKNDRNRSAQLAEVVELFKAVPICWVSLQVGAEGKNLQNGTVRICNFSDLLTDFSETAALIANLDLVIAVDTAVAHLAGAMGKKTWLLLPFAPEWRWQLQREDSPWYPTMRIFRQNRVGEWRELLERVAAALKKEIEDSEVESGGMV